MLRAESQCEFGVFAIESNVPGRTLKRSQGVGYHCDVDALLQDGAPHRCEQTDRRKSHRAERHPDADNDALHGDASRSTGDHERITEAVQSIDGENDVSGFG